MKEKEFNLSEKRIFAKNDLCENKIYFYFESDIKEFIRLLKKKVHEHYGYIDLDSFDKIINKLSGDKLK